jgi:tRNA-dihydrouridine synthase
MRDPFIKTTSAGKDTLFRAMLEHFEEGRPLEELQALLMEYFKNMPEKKKSLNELLTAADKMHSAYEQITRLEKELPEH